MQIVVRVEKDPSPSHTAVLRATASTVALAIDAFTRPDADPEVRERTERWRSGPIRKVVRRARGAGWTRQPAVAGVFEHQVHGVDVAVHVPGPVDEVDYEISRLQVGGLTLEDPDDVTHPGADVQLWLNPHVTLTTGKAAAEVGHASRWCSRTCLRPAQRPGSPTERRSTSPSRRRPTGTGSGDRSGGGHRRRLHRGRARDGDGRRGPLICTLDIRVQECTL